MKNKSYGSSKYVTKVKNCILLSTLTSKITRFSRQLFDFFQKMIGGCPFYRKISLLWWWRTLLGCSVAQNLANVNRFTPAFRGAAHLPHWLVGPETSHSCSKNMGECCDQKCRKVVAKQKSYGSSKCLTKVKNCILLSTLSSKITRFSRQLFDFFYIVIGKWPCYQEISILRSSRLLPACAVLCNNVSVFWLFCNFTWP